MSKKPKSTLLVTDDLNTDTPENKTRNQALHHVAHHLAQALGYGIDLLHVDQTPLELGKFLKKKSNGDVHKKYVLLQGYAPDQILKYASKKKTTRLILQGTHGYTGLKRMILGSVAEELIRHASLPVLTIGPEAQPRVLEKNPMYFSRIFLASDLGPNSEPATKYTLQLASELKAHVTIVHSVFADLHPVIKTALSSPSGSKEIAQYIDDLCKKQTRTLEKTAKLFMKKGVHCDVVLDKSTSSPDEGILQKASEVANLIICGTHGRSLFSAAFLGSTARSLILRSTTPVITVASRAKSRPKRANRR